MKEVNKNRKDEILSHHTEVNVDEIWAAIEPQVDLINAEKKRKRRFLIFFLFGAMLLASGGLYIWQNGTVSENVAVHIDTKTQITDVLNEEDTYNWASNEDVNINELAEGSKQPKISIDHKAEVIEEEVIKDNNRQSIKPTAKSVILPNEQSLEEAKAIVYSIFTKEKIVLHDINNVNPKPNAKDDAFSKEDKLRIKRNLHKKRYGTKIPPSPIILNYPAPLQTNIPDVGEVKPDQKYVKANDDGLPGGKLNFALAANTGVSFINRGLASNIPGNTSPEVLRLRRESETLLEAIHYGIRGKLTHKSGFSFSSGAQYTVLTERYDNNNLEVASDSIQGVVKRVVQFNGDTLDVMGLVPRTTTYDYEKQIYNRYKMIDVPFIVGFEGGMEKWSLGIQAGVFLNLALKTSGQIRSTATEDINIGDNQADVFKNKVGLSYYGGIYIRRELSPNLDVTIAPHGRFFAQDFNVTDYDLKQRYSLVGIQAGLSYRFGYQ